MRLQRSDLSSVIRLVTLHTSFKSGCVGFDWKAACAGQGVCMCVCGQQIIPASSCASPYRASAQVANELI